MSAIEELISAYHDAIGLGECEITDAARAELASLRAAVAERDAAIARERAEEREACASLAKSYEFTIIGNERDRRKKVANQIAAAIRARGEAKE